MTCWQNECLSRTLKSEELVFDALQYHQLPKTFQSKISHAFMKKNWVFGNPSSLEGPPSTPTTLRTLANYFPAQFCPWIIVMLMKIVHLFAKDWPPPPRQPNSQSITFLLELISLPHIPCQFAKSSPHQLHKLLHGHQPLGVLVVPHLLRIPAVYSTGKLWKNMKSICLIFLHLFKQATSSHGWISL